MPDNEPREVLLPVPVPPSERAELFLELERTAETGAYVWEPGRRLLWSEGFFRLLGLDPTTRTETSGGDLLFSRVHPDDRDYVREHWLGALAGNVATTRYRIIRPDGKLRYLRSQGTVSFGADGAPQRIVGTIVDVTDAQRAVEELSRAHTLLNETQLAAGVGMYVFEPSSGRLEWSEGLYRLYGIDPSVPPTRELTQRATFPDDLERHLDWGRRLIAGEATAPLLLRIRRPDGSIRHTENRGRLLTDKDGSVRVVGICIDVTARVELETRLQQAAKMEAVGTLAAGVAHDFNNFLTVLVCQMDELQNLAPPSLQPQVEDARHAAEQCALLTEKLLAFARKQPPALGKLELRAILRRVEGALRRVCAPGIVVTMDVPNHPVYVRGEAAQLESLVMNLALNARDAMPHGGTLGLAVKEVTLESGNSALDPDHLPGNYAAIQVTDSGLGIAPDHLPRIFEPYFSAKATGRGTGLGLASVYGSVRQHRGSIRVESKLGEGSTFHVFLPSEPKDEPSASEPKTPRGLTSPLKGRHVLVVEDVDVVRRTVVAGLERAGARVTAVNDGVYALEFLSGGATADIVLTDLIMPRMGGLELARELGRLYPELPLVFMSGYADHEVVEAIVSERPDQPLLRKPFSVKELTDALSSTLERAASR